MFGRYKNISQQTKDYVKGMYGKSPGPISDKIYETVLGPNWKDEVVTARPADLLEPRMKTAREELEKLGLIRKPEDVLTYVLYPQVGLKFLKGEAKAEFTGNQLPIIKKVASDVPAKPAYPMAGKIKVDGTEYNVNMLSDESIEVNGRKYTVSLMQQGGAPQAAGQIQPAASSGPSMPVKSPMLGTILKIKVKPGQAIKEGEVVAVLEAMKMENDIPAPKTGTVASVTVNEGQSVEEGTVIAMIN